MGMPLSRENDIKGRGHGVSRDGEVEPLGQVYILPSPITHPMMNIGINLL